MLKSGRKRITEDEDGWMASADSMNHLGWNKLRSWAIDREACTAVHGSVKVRLTSNTELKDINAEILFQITCQKLAFEHELGIKSESQFCNIHRER